jgi:hypothetical protein
MVKCTTCNQEFADIHTISCIEIGIEFPDGAKMSQVPYDNSFTCPGCGVINGRVHHTGCSEEICPRCGGYLISCKCLKPNKKK